jgi:glycosyltransferase involved in cell wall biosynthesis
MIVKNEAHIIRRTLEMLLTKVRFDYWVICDTGSTDATREIIREFFSSSSSSSSKGVNIPGELHCDEWVNFAHNRTKALEYAFNKTDLLLVFDADDDIHGTIVLPSTVSHDEYHLKFGAPNTGGITYTRTLLINNRKRFQYYSVVHEFISCREPSANEQARLCVLDGDYFVVSGRSGARNQDPDKYLKDALLLEKAHAEAVAQGDDLHKRYAFYCANSYRDCGRREDAIRWYKITLTQDNWAQEKYAACLYIYECYEALGQKEHGFFYLVKAFSYDLERVECLYPLIVHYCCEGMNEVAYNYYRMVEKQFLQNGWNETSGKLFLQTDKADFFVPYYMIIVADRVGDRACGIRMYETVFKRKHRVLSAWHLRNLMFNLRFFIGHVATDALGAFAALANGYLQFIRENGVPLSTFDEVVKDFNYDKYGIHLLNQSLKPSTNPLIVANFSRSVCKRSHNILFYTGYCNVPWNYSSMKRGALGGSEKAVAYLAQELCRNGYTVYVSGSVQPEELSAENGDEVSVKYVGLSGLPELLRTTAFHTVVCSRYISFLELYAGASSFYQFYIWAHDTHLIPYGCDLSDTAIVEKWSDHIDGCVCQTQWHADEYVSQYPALKSKIRVINNGIDLELFPRPISKKTNRFIYTSRTERGLSRILDLWPDIVAALPDATLVISTYVAFPCNDDERRIQERIAHLNQTYLGQNEEEGRIRHLGQLNPTQLYAEMGAAEYWLYPTDWPETSCITAMEMLMSEVICFYYPVAGLTETMGGCGIQIAPGSGSNVQTLAQIAIDETKKEALRKQGRAYAESCSWVNRAQQWDKMVTSRVERVAIFNSFPFHYVMFGYILAHFANATKNKNIHFNCNCKVSLFTETKNDMGWLDFYKTHFGGIEFEYECKPVSEFCDARHRFDIIFVPTDDDFAFKREWIDERCISIEHHISVRRPEYMHRVGVRPFAASSKRWALPCYEIVSPNDKIDALLPESEIHVAMVGLNGVINYELVNRLSVQSGVKLQLHCIGSRVTIEFADIIVHVHKKMDTSKMIELLIKCDYVLTDYQNDDHINGISMSGVVPLAFSTLTPLIISKRNNAIYGFKNAVEFEMNSTERIMLSKKGGDDIVKLNAEKNGLISMFDQIVADIVAGNNECD